MGNFTERRKTDEARRIQKARFEQRMHRIKRKNLGSGCFGTVFTGRQGTVIKCGPIDDTWLLWAAWCNAYTGPGKEHMPVIYKVRRYPKLGVYVAHLEGLSGNMCGEKEFCNHFQDAKWAYSRGKLQFPQDDLTVTGQQFGEGKPGAYLMHKMAKFASVHDICWDLHPWNAMWRGSTIVITDPFSGGGECLTQEQLKVELAA